MKTKENTFTFRGSRFLAVVCVGYLLLLIFSPENVLPALKRSGSVLTKVLPILFIVILLTSVLSYFLKPEKLAGNLGEDSGAKGWFFAITAGLMSHGPMYAWYPLFDDLLENGLKKSLIVTYLATRTIKLPLLPMMIDYFGLKFTMVLTGYVLLGALFQGLIYTGIEKRHDKQNLEEAN